MSTCSLPKTLEYVCKFGCIYRDQTLRHIACKKTQTQACVAPCQVKKDCGCYPPSFSIFLRPTTPFYFYSVCDISRTQSLQTQYRHPTCKGQMVCAKQ